MNWQRCVMCLSLLGLVLGHVPAEAGSVEFNPQPIISLTNTGLRFEWHAPTRIDSAWPGFTQVTEPGLPRLPMFTALIALSPNARPTVNIIEHTEQTLGVPGPLSINPQPGDVQRAETGSRGVIGGAFVPALPLPWSHAWIELQPLGVMRGVTLARLAFYPVRPAGRQVRVTTHIQVEVLFNAPISIPNPSPDAFERMLQSLVVNPNSVVSQPVLKTAPLAPAGDLAVEVDLVGITALTYEALAASGFPVTTTNPAWLQLTRAGNEIALEWEGDADALFEPGERLLFYAAPRFSRWMNGDVYFLSDVGAPVTRMTTRSAGPTGLPTGIAWLTQTAEANVYYTPECYCAPIPPGRDGERWTWADLRQPGAPTATFPFQVTTVDASRPISLTMWLIGYTNIAAANPDHRVNVSLNGVALGAVEWDSKTGITATWPISPGGLMTGTNTLSLTLPGLPGVPVEGEWLDAFALRYARGAEASGESVEFVGEATRHAYTLAFTNTVGLRAYDVTLADQPMRLTELAVMTDTLTLGDPPDNVEHRYVLTTENALRAPARLRLTTPLPTFSGADYLIITHADFIPALSEFLALRQSQMSVAVVDVQAIYDAADGRPTPQAIRAYLAEAYANWAPRPTYVLLVGDGTSDPKHYRVNTTTTFIPPFLEEVDPWAGETAADNRYVMLEGEDVLPDMVIGRWPVNTLAEAQTIADKVVQYETQPANGNWKQTATFVADNADAAGNFPAQAQTLAEAWIAPPVISQTIFYTPPTTTVTATQQAILSQWNAGSGLLAYFGHASTHQWAAERFIHDTEIGALLNTGPRWPVVLEMTCFTGSFQTPGLPTLDETLLRDPDGGVVVVWGATGLGVSTGHDLLAEGFLQSVYQAGEARVGLAMLAGKLNLMQQTSAYPDLIDTFTVLGDPALTFRFNRVYLPVIRR